MATEYPDLNHDIAELPTAFLECRTLGHAWHIVYMGPTAASKDDDLIGRARNHKFNPDGARILQCTRCYTQRIDLCLVGYGRKEYAYRLIGRQYRYPDNYRIEGGVQNHRELLHHELFDRAVGGQVKKGRR